MGIAKYGTYIGRRKDGVTLPISFSFKTIRTPAITMIIEKAKFIILVMISKYFLGVWGR